MADQEAQEALFERVNGFIKNGQHKKALKLLEEVLKHKPQDTDALQCKVVALVQLNDFEAALKIIHNAKLYDKLPLEKAYCLYRLSRFDDSLKVLQGMPEDDLGRLQLEAQLQHRLGAHKRCIQLYDRLFQLHRPDQADLKGNVLAAYVFAQQPEELPELMSSLKVTGKSSFEVGFNKACGLCETGLFAAAEAELKQAIRLGRETLAEEDATDEEIDEQLAPLLAQLAYVLGRLGRLPEAIEQYKNIIEATSSDDLLFAVTTSNQLADTLAATALASLNPSAPQPPPSRAQPPAAAAGAGAAGRRFWSHALKKLESFMDKAQEAPTFKANLEAKLTARQKGTLMLNYGMLCLVGGRTERAEGVVGVLEGVLAAAGAPGQWTRQQQHLAELLLLLKAAVLAKQGQVDAADALLSKVTGVSREQALSQHLMRAQLAVDSGNMVRALEVLGCVPDAEVAASPAMVATRIALVEQVGDADQAEKLLETGLNLLQSSKKGGTEGVAQCWRQLIATKMRLGKTREAVEAYRQLKSGSMDPGARIAVEAELAQAAALQDLDAAELLEKLLPKAPASLGVDAAALETAIQSVGATRRKEEVGKKRLADREEGEKKKKKKKRKKLLPKNFDPQNPGPMPDPERWLPKWQRSNYKRKKGRNRNAGPVKGSQGAGKVDENLDRAAKMDEDGPGTSGGDKPASRPALPQRSGKGKGRR